MQLKNKRKTLFTLKLLSLIKLLLFLSLGGCARDFISHVLLAGKKNNKKNNQKKEKENKHTIG